MVNALIFATIKLFPLLLIIEIDLITKKWRQCVKRY